MTKQQTNDYQMLVKMWHVLRDYGNLTNNDDDLPRWSKMFDLSDEIVRNYPESRKLVMELRFILNDRAKSQN